MYRVQQNTSKAEEWSWSAASLLLNYRDEEIEPFSISISFVPAHPDAGWPYLVMR